MEYPIIHLPHTLHNTMVSFNIATITLLKPDWYFSLEPLFPFPSGHMHFSQLHISLIVFPHLGSRCPLPITSSSSLLPIIPTPCRWLFVLSMASTLLGAQTLSSFRPCIFLGYSLTQSVYICYDPSTTMTYHSRHVCFVESISPFSSVHPSLPRSIESTISTWFPVTLVDSTTPPASPAVDHTLDFMHLVPRPLLLTSRPLSRAVPACSST